MKKIYTRYRAGLLVALLSFHTLSSCVNRGHALGMANQSNEEIKTEIEIARQKYAQTCILNGIPIHDPKKAFPWSKLYIATGVLIVAIPSISYLLWPSGPNPIEVNPISTMTNTTISYIGNATTDLVAAVGPVAANTSHSIGQAANTTLAAVATAAATTVATAVARTPSLLLPKVGIMPPSKTPIKDVPLQFLVDKPSNVDSNNNDKNTIIGLGPNTATRLNPLFLKLAILFTKKPDPFPKNEKPQ